MRDKTLKVAKQAQLQKQMLVEHIYDENLQVYFKFKCPYAKLLPLLFFGENESYMDMLGIH